MITLDELLQDKRYREFFIKLPPPRTAPPLPWRLYVQRTVEGRWSKKDFDSYAGAFNLLRRLRKEGIHDAAIHSRGLSYSQPTRLVRVRKNGKPVMVVGSNGAKSQKTVEIPWLPQLPPDESPHTWCVYCRRPTVFRFFSKHHAFKDTIFDIGHIERCTICGVSISLIRGY